MKEESGIMLPVSIPQLYVSASILPEAWEKSLIALKSDGISSRKESYTDPKGVDHILEASMTMVVKTPAREPMLHRGCEGLFMLGQYVEEVLEGVKDSYIGEYWDYTYHQRLFKYESPEGQAVNQIQYLAKKLTECSFTNRAQATTWMPWRDQFAKGPPCLQRIWCKVVSDEYLEMHTSWRSRDAYNAAFMNMYALVQLQKTIANQIGVKVGQYVDYSDSYHVYQRNLNQLDKFLETVRKNREMGISPWAPSNLLKKFQRNDSTK
ncbi:MAG: thymidylate synthase [Thermoproteota archaeon]